MATIKVSCPLNHNLTVTAHSGHFATRHSHNSHYIDITELKHRHISARAAAMELAGPVGMLLGVPAASAGYALLREATTSRELATHRADGTAPLTK